MAEPRFRRRKADRPAEITQAALAAFAEKGYDATRVEDVAKRAGVSKGLLYLYFRTKEELFKAVIRSFIVPRIDALRAEIEETDLSAEAYIRGPFFEFARSIPRSPVRIMVRLIVAEGPKHPDLIAYYWDNVVSQGVEALRRLIARGVERGEFIDSPLSRFPQLLVAPVLFSVIWVTLFQDREELDTDSFIESHLELLLTSIKRSDAGTAPA